MEESNKLPYLSSYQDAKDEASQDQAIINEISPEELYSK